MCLPLWSWRLVLVSKVFVLVLIHCLENCGLGLAFAMGNMVVGLINISEKVCGLVSLVLGLHVEQTLL